MLLFPSMYLIRLLILHSDLPTRPHKIWRGTSKRLKPSTRIESRIERKLCTNFLCNYRGADFWAVEQLDENLGGHSSCVYHIPCPMAW